MKLAALIITASILFGVSLNTFIIVHFEYNYEFIVSVVCVEKDIEDSCCKGSCHLNDEFSKTNHNKAPEDAFAITSLELLSWFSSEKSDQECIFNPYEENRRVNPKFNLILGVYGSIDHPPQV